MERTRVYKSFTHTYKKDKITSTVLVTMFHNNYDIIKTPIIFFLLLYDGRRLCETKDNNTHMVLIQYVDFITEYNIH